MIILSLNLQMTEITDVVVLGQKPNKTKAVILNNRPMR